MNKTIKQTGNDFEVESIDDLVLCSTTKTEKTPEETIYNQANPNMPYCVSNKPCEYKKQIGRDLYCTWYKIMDKDYE